MSCSGPQQPSSEHCSWQVLVLQAALSTLIIGNCRGGGRKVGTHYENDRDIFWAFLWEKCLQEFKSLTFYFWHYSHYPDRQFPPIWQCQHSTVSLPRGTPLPLPSLERWALWSVEQSCCWSLEHTGSQLRGKGSKREVLESQLRLWNDSPWFQTVFDAVLTL